VRVALRLVGIRWVVEGREHIQTHRAAVYAVNHSSNLEPPVLFLVLAPLFPRVRILYKAELRRLPILTTGFDLAGFVPIERRRREQAAAAIDEAARGLAAGYSFLVFPEGTRSASGALLPFKKGGFVMAIKAQAPIVPMAVCGARAAMQKGGFFIRPVTLRVRLAAPIETAGLSLADRDRVMARVRAEIERLLGDAGDQIGELPAAAAARGACSS
jgi:1-acyl-sn-glycerol-3-phosphate acyltransferase